MREGFEPQFNNPDNQEINPETNNQAEQSPEVQAEAKGLNEKFVRVSEELENVDLTKIEPTEALKLQGKIEVICSALIVAAGVGAAYCGGEAIMDKIQPWNDTLRAMSAGVGFVGVASAMYGLERMVNGYRKFLGYVKKDEAEAYQKLG